MSVRRLHRSSAARFLAAMSRSSGRSMVVFMRRRYHKYGSGMGARAHIGPECVGRSRPRKRADDNGFPPARFRDDKAIPATRAAGLN